MNNYAIEKELDWDDTIEKESEFVLLPEGDYDFTVTTFERTRHPGSEKLPPCHKAVIHLKIDAPEGSTTVKHNLFMHTRTEGMISAFFLSIGLKKHGEPFKMNWNAVPGSTGRCKIGIREYNGKQFNEVKRLYEKSNAVNQPKNTFLKGTF